MKEESLMRFPTLSTGRRSPRPTSCSLLISEPLERSLQMVNTFGLSHPSFNVHLENRNRRTFGLPLSSVKLKSSFLPWRITFTSLAIFSSESLLSCEKYPAHEASIFSRVALRYASYSGVFCRVSSFFTLAFNISINFFLSQPSFLPSGPRKLSMLSIKNSASVLIGSPSRQKFSRSVSKWRIKASSIIPSW